MQKSFCIALLSIGIAAGFAADKAAPEAPAEAARLRFVPEGPQWKGESVFDGAAWTMLGPSPVPGELMLHARAGIGDKFPVQEKAKVKLFEVVLKDGNDEHLVLEVQSKDGVQKIEVARDVGVPVEVGGVKYMVTFPTLRVQASAGELPSTNKATIIVSRKKAEKEKAEK